jgi:hypothetical protein
MAQVGGYWVNCYGKVADIVITVVGYEQEDNYTVNLQYVGPDGEGNRTVSATGIANEGETIYHVFPMEVIGTNTPKEHGIFTWVDSNSGPGKWQQFPATQIQSGDVNFNRDNPVSGLTSEVPVSETFEVGVQAVRREGQGKIPNSNVYSYPVLIEGDFVWYADGGEIGREPFKFKPDWQKNEWDQTVQEHPVSTVQDVSITTPNTIGDYQFCCRIENEKYYVPDGTTWHTPINTL